MDKPKVYLPPWSGFPVIDEWTERVYSGMMIGTKHMIKVLNTKGKEITMMKWVVWDES